MSFPEPPTDGNIIAPVEPTPSDAALSTPVPHMTNRARPRWSAWALVGTICAIITFAGMSVAIRDGTILVLLPTAVLAVVCGLRGLVSISESGGRLKGRGLAVAGVILGAIGIIVLTQILTTQLLSTLPTHLFPSDD